VGKVLLQLEMSAEQVRRRFKRALKSGTPTWLWPEVAVQDWRSIVETIERITSDVLARGKSATRLTGEPAAVSVAAFTTGMGPLLGHWQQEGRISASEDSVEVLGYHLAHNRKRMECLSLRAIELVDHFARHGVEATVLKGMHTAFAYFPDPATRPMSDIDILIEPAAERAAGLVLQELGFRHSGKPEFPERTWRRPELPSAPKNLYFVHEDDQWSIDLHLTLDLTPTSVAPPIKLDSSNTRAGAPWALSGAACQLTNPALILHLAVHAGIHLPSLSLLRLTELVLAIRKDTALGSLSWDELHSAAQRAGALGALHPAFELCEKLAPGTVPNAIKRACRQNAPAAVVQLIDGLTPATAQGILRCSVEERFMWLPSGAAIARQVLYDLLPLKRNMSEILWIYRMLFWRMLNRTVSR
jgi:hypothetical protein